MDFVGARIAEINFFKLILKNHTILCDSVMKRHLCPCCSLVRRAGAIRHFNALWRPWYYLWCCYV